MADGGGGNVAESVQEAVELLQEITEDKNPSTKDLQKYLQRKDGIVGTGQHHRKRNVTRGQIMGDLTAFISKFGS
jgi:hypothetical protein